MNVLNKHLCQKEFGVLVAELVYVYEGGENFGEEDFTCLAHDVELKTGVER